MTLQTVWETLKSQFEQTLAFIDQARLLTPQRAEAILIATVILFLVPFVDQWLRGSRPGHVKFALAGFLLPCALLVLLQTPQGFVGAPDDQCDRYDEGKLTFTIIAAVPVPHREDDLYGGDSLLILVRAPRRWGDVPHQCRLSFSDAKARELWGLIRGEIATGRYSRDSITFTFGTRNEIPNVKIQGRPPEEKIGPPEVSPRERRGA